MQLHGIWIFGCLKPHFIGITIYEWVLKWNRSSKAKSISDISSNSMQKQLVWTSNWKDFSPTSSRSAYGWCVFPWKSVPNLSVLPRSCFIDHKGTDLSERLPRPVHAKSGLYWSIGLTGLNYYHGIQHRIGPAQRCDNLVDDAEWIWSVSKWYYELCPVFLPSRSWQCIGQYVR